MLHVLVVDDARLVADLAATPLGRAHVRVERAAPFEDLVARALVSRPDVVIFGDGEGCPEPRDSCRRLRKDERMAGKTIVYIGSILSRRASLDGGFDLYVPRLGTTHELGQALAGGLALPQRSAPRWPVDVSCRIESDETSLTARCIDLSLGGCRLIAPTGLGPGASAAVRFEAEPRGVRIDGSVVREHEFDQRAARELALRFDLADIEARVRGCRFVRYLAERRLGPADAATRGAVN